MAKEQGGPGEATGASRAHEEGKGEEREKEKLWQCQKLMSIGRRARGGVKDSCPTTCSFEISCYGVLLAGRIWIMDERHCTAFPLYKYPWITERTSSGWRTACHQFVSAKRIKEGMHFVSCEEDDFCAPPYY